MFILYAVLVGLLAGRLAGGRFARLGELRLRWTPLAFVGLFVQLFLFSSPATPVIGAAGPPIYVASTAAVLAFVLRNLAVPGFILIAAGSISNLVAIVANGGYMPTTAEAVAAAGLGPAAAGYSNSVETDAAVLTPLTDIFSMPPWMPFANVFSIGDVLIALGVAWAIVAAMRAPAAATLAATGADGSAVPMVTPVGATSTNGGSSGSYPTASVGAGSDVRCSTSHPSRANPSRDGDAKPGIRGLGRVTARLPGRRRGPTVGGLR